MLDLNILSLTLVDILGDFKKVFKDPKAFFFALVRRSFIYFSEFPFWDIIDPK